MHPICHPFSPLNSRYRIVPIIITRSLKTQIFLHLRLKLLSMSSTISSSGCLVTSDWLGAARSLPEVLLAIRRPSISTLVRCVVLDAAVAVTASRGSSSARASILTSL